MKQSKDGSIVVTSEDEGLVAENGRQMKGWREAAFDAASTSNRRRKIIRRLLTERATVKARVKQASGQLDFIDELLAGRKKR